MPSPSFTRSIVRTLAERVREPHVRIQVVTGPRQTGKTTALNQVLEGLDFPAHYVEVPANVSTDDWLRAQWQQARYLTRDGTTPALLVIDEVQLLDQWSSYVRELWDQDVMADLDLRVVLSGSSALLLNKGLREGLTGRFEVIRFPQWSFAECREAFGYELEDYLEVGGYPGATRYLGDEGRWLDYMVSAVVEPSISRDVLALEPVRKPALMRRLGWHVRRSGVCDDPTGLRQVVRGGQSGSGECGAATRRGFEQLRATPPPRPRSHGDPVPTDRRPLRPVRWT